MSEHVLADTTAGKVVGERQPYGAVFRGIPYSTAQRFEAPTPPSSWPEPRECLTWGAMCPQSPSPLDMILGTGQLDMDEDCLTVNVYTPACDDGLRPVLVWIHGGGFTSGTAATAWYSGSSFARNGDVVVVTVNYRLNIFGFLHVPGATNLGLRDQIAALRWVSDNIASFGGDPGNVTIFGESAGGCSVVALLAAPSARGLFRQAAAQSPSLVQLRTAEVAAHWASRTFDVLGVSGLDSARELPTERLVAAQQEVLASGGEVWFEAFAPAPDGDVLPGPVLEAIRNGSAAGVTLLAGVTRDEMRLFTFLDPALTGLDGVALVDRLSGRFGRDAPRVAEHYGRSRPGATPAQVYAAVASDATFRRPLLDLAARQLPHAPVYLYLFRWETPVLFGQIGSCHALEIPFVFDNVHQNGVTTFTGDGPERFELAQVMNGAWTSFARSGSPGWAPYDLERRPIMVFDHPECGVEHDPDGDLLALWPTDQGADRPGASR